jgi:hypothetical protein
VHPFQADAEVPRRLRSLVQVMTHRTLGADRARCFRCLQRCLARRFPLAGRCEVSCQVCRGRFAGLDQGVGDLVVEQFALPH